MIGAALALTYAIAAPASRGCSDPAFHVLDFWIGTWDVYVGNQRAGRDVVSTELNGCALIERWTDADGSRGMSFFAYDPFSGRFRQTWVTEDPSSLGGLKYKTMIARLADGGVRFEGVLPSSPSQRPVLDRTTLTPMTGGSVHQVIENSVDGGEHWRVAFDAVYRRAER